MRSTFVTAILFLSLCPAISRAQAWSTEFGAPPSGNGLNSSVQALFEYQNRLIVGGSYTQAGTLGLSRIAAWDGTHWSALGEGLANPVEAVTEYDGDLIAAGGIGLGQGFLKRWDGLAWSTIPLPSGNATILLDVCPYRGSLYINSLEGGVSKLAWWDGQDWAGVPIPLDAQHTDAQVYAMTVYNEQLFITGVGPWNEGGFLFSWDGEAFGGPGWVFPSGGNSLHVYHQLLYVGGDWYPAPPLDGVAIWDQNAWIPFGPGPTGVWDMTTYHGRIVMGGSGVTSFTGITYNGQNEQQLGGGCQFTMWVWAAREFQGDLYVGGSFDNICTQSAQVQAYNFARWSEPVTAVSPSSSAKSLRIESAPNPFNPSVVLTMRVPARSHVTVEISDATGRIVRRVASGVQDAGPYRITWDGVSDNGERLASGVYFARVTAGTQTATSKLVLLK